VTFLSQKGFTLVEVLVALVIASMLAVVVFSGLHLSIRSSETISRVQQESGRAFVTQHTLRRILGSIQDERIRDSDGLDQVAFYGAQREMVFIGALTQVGDANQLYWLMLRIEQGYDGEDRLVLRVKPYDRFDNDTRTNGLLRTQLDWDLLLEELALTNNVTRIDYPVKDAFQFEYLGVDLSKNTEWVQDWQTQDALPAMIKLDFTEEFEDYWPDLLVVPRVNAYAIKSVF